MDKNTIKEMIYNCSFLKVAEFSPAEAAGKNKSFSKKEAKQFAKQKNIFTLEQAEDLGSKIGIKWNKVDFTINDFLVGLSVETEHFDDKETSIGKFAPTIAGRIAWRHLKENPKYYTRLKD